MGLVRHLARSVERVWFRGPRGPRGPSDSHGHFGNNLVERWFRELTDKALRRGEFHSVPEAIASIEG